MDSSCGYKSVDPNHPGFIRSQLIWIYTVFKGNVRILKKEIHAVIRLNMLVIAMALSV